MAHKGFKGTFFKKSFLILKEKEAETVASVSNNTDENATIEDMASFHSILNSSQGEKVSLLSMALKKHRKENYQVEVTLTKFANIHIQNDIKYKDAAQRILLQQNVSTITIVINHFVVQVGKDHHKNQNLTKLYTKTKALNFSNWYPTTL